MGATRAEKAIYIIITGAILQAITLIFGFISRTIFIKFLGMEYLGINSLFNNILTMLSLADLGFGTAMLYFLYKPLANKDTNKLRDLMAFYKIIYRYVGLAIFILGIMVIPFLNKLVNFENRIDLNLVLVYILFLFDAVVSYLFFAYRSSIFTADQKGYVVNTINLIFVIIESLVEIVIIIVFRNFIASLIAKIGIKIIKNIVISIAATKLYPFIKDSNSEKLPSNVIKELKEKVYSIFIFRISYRMFNSTDNMIISAFIGTVYVGINANYLMIISSVNKVMDIIISSLVGAVGNINSVESNEIKYTMFKRLNFLNFWINSCCGVCLFQLFNPFITLWLGEEFLFSKLAVGIIVANFISVGFLNIVYMYRETMGLFEYGRYRQLIGGIINIILSIIFAKVCGVVGVFLATLISTTITTTFLYPKVIYKYSFKKTFKEYVLRYLFYCILTIVSCGIVSIISSLFIKELNYLTFILQAVISFTTPCIMYSLIFRKSDEYIYFKLKAIEIINKYMGKVRGKIDIKI